MYEYEIIPGLDEGQLFWFTVVITILFFGAIGSLAYQPKKHVEIYRKVPAALFLLIPIAFIAAYYQLPHKPVDNLASFHAAEAAYKDDIHKAEAREIQGVVFESQQNDNPLSSKTRDGSMKVHTLDGILDCAAKSTPGKVSVLCEDGRTLAEIADFNEDATTKAVAALRDEGLDFHTTVDYKIAAGRTDTVQTSFRGRQVPCDVKLTGKQSAEALCLNEKVTATWD